MSSKPSLTATVPGVQLQVANDFSTTPQPITDPTGTASAMQLSTTNVGIGVTPSYPLHVGIGQTVRFELSNGALMSLGGSGAFNVDAVNIPAGRFTVTDSGQVGIKQPNPKYTLDVNGTINATGLNLNGQFALPGIQPESSAPSSANLQAVYVDTNTGILYYHS